MKVGSAAYGGDMIDHGQMTDCLWRRRGRGLSRRPGLMKTGPARDAQWSCRLDISSPATRLESWWDSDVTSWRSARLPGCVIDFAIDLTWWYCVTYTSLQRLTWRSATKIWFLFLTYTLHPSGLSHYTMDETQHQQAGVSETDTVNSRVVSDRSLLLN